jgi:hypothetical protein
MELRSTITCPHCGWQETETIPTDADLIVNLRLLAKLRPDFAFRQLGEMIEDCLEKALSPAITRERTIKELLRLGLANPVISRRELPLSTKAVGEVASSLKSASAGYRHSCSLVKGCSAISQPHSLWRFLKDTFVRSQLVDLPHLRQT